MIHRAPMTREEMVEGMPTMKCLNHDIYNIPQTIILNKNNKLIKLNKIKYSKEYSSYYTINGYNYA